MVSLMPGLPGTKGVFGISRVREDLTLAFPPEALAHYGISNGDEVVLQTGHVGRAGFGMASMARARGSIFADRVAQLGETGDLRWFGDRAMVVLRVEGGSVDLGQEVLRAFHLEVGDRLLVVKSTTVNMGLAPVEVWEESMRRHGFPEAVDRMRELRER